jgi:hypothetical protein
MVQMEMANSEGSRLVAALDSALTAKEQLEEAAATQVADTEAVVV